MKDRTYLPARATLQINASARAQSYERAFKYPVPRSAFKHTDPDPYHVPSMLKLNSGRDRPTISFPRAGTNTHTHLL